MYPRVITLKQMFSEFFPKYKASVVRDEDAWKLVDPNHMYWANDALNLKRSGDYVGACKLYFDQIIRRGATTIGWAEGIFKNLAAAGDIADAVAFGFDWYNRFTNQALFSANVDSDKLAMHLGNLIVLIKNNPDATITLPDYLKSISGNPNYTIDLNQTDLYTDTTLRSMRNS